MTSVPSPLSPTPALTLAPAPGPELATLTLTDLCDAVDVTPRTVRYYIQQGLLSPAAGAGLAACYNAAHLRRLRVVKALQARHLPLAEIRARLEHLTEADER
ncbi:MAG: MerR family transcriptional regulator, partial [Myxococcales bacterium]|nr:MerR family transcriptional regulator [Myxococcales bacterium]